MSKVVFKNADHLNKTRVTSSNETGTRNSVNAMNYRKTTDFTVSPRIKLNPRALSTIPQPETSKPRALPFEDGVYLPHVYVNNHGSKVTFKFQEGSVKEHGLNGCHIGRMLQFAKHFLEVQNAGKNRNRENALCITRLQEAIMWLEHRDAERFYENSLGPHILPKFEHRSQLDHIESSNDDSHDMLCDKDEVLLEKSEKSEVSEVSEDPETLNNAEQMV